MCVQTGTTKCFYMQQKTFIHLQFLHLLLLFLTSLLLSFNISTSSHPPGRPRNIGVPSGNTSSPLPLIYWLLCSPRPGQTRANQTIPRSPPSPLRPWALRVLLLQPSQHPLLSESLRQRSTCNFPAFQECNIKAAIHTAKVNSFGSPFLIIPL